MSFSGFSEDDIRKFTKTNQTPEKVFQTSFKKTTLKPNRKSNIKHKTIPLNSIPENAKLTLSNELDAKIEETESKDEIIELKKETNSKIEKPVLPSLENGLKVVKKIDLVEFESRQKLIEEQNRKRKELLAKALADRTKRTQEEILKLNSIQEEFKKLDAMLSADVKILRKKIEIASIDFNECQKKYDRVEKEFLEAKVLLHQKQEKKEMLTEHLCTIIERNEERKAVKLNELLEKLDVENGDSKEENEDIKET